MEDKNIAGYVIIFAIIGLLILVANNIYKSKRPALGFSLFFGIPTFFLLSFHIIPSRLKVFPKDNFTFNNTIINEDDIDALIKRYNNANIFEKAAIRNEALPKKLIEKGIIESEASK